MFSEEVCKGRRVIILLALFCVPFFINLGANSLWDGNEGFYAEPPRELLESGDWLVPTYNYEPRFKKPPFTTWIIAACYYKLGVSEFSARLPIAIAATLTVLLVYALGRRIVDARTGLAAALVLATMLKYMVYARQYAGDIFLTLLITASLTGFAYAVVAPPGRARLGWLLLAYGASGLGMLDKGLVAIVIPFVVMGLFILVQRRWDLLVLLFHPLGYLVILAIGLPWYLMMAGRYGWEFIQVNIIQETVQRYVTDQLGGRAAYYYIGVYLAETLPWSLFTLPVLIYWIKWLRQQFHTLSRQQPRESLMLLPFIWFLFVFIFFSVSIGKRAVYLVVLYPAAALLIGHYFTACLFQRDRLLMQLHRIVTLLLIVVCTGAAIVLLIGHSKLEMPTLLIYLPIAVLIMLSITLTWQWWRGDFTTQAQLLVIAALVLIFGLTLVMPKLEYYRPVPRFARLIKEQAARQDEVGTFCVDAPSLMFYTERKIFQSCDFDEMLKRLDSDRQVYFITRADYLEMLQGRTPIPLEILARQPLLQLRWENFFARSSSPSLSLVLVRKS
ncbi:MAG: glycosyltransferase family 39 protein [Acidobacteriota bacterium]